MGLTGRNFLSAMEAVQTTNRAQAMIDGLRRGLGLLVQLMTDIVQQSGLGDLGQRLHRRLQPPAGEVQQVICVGPQRTQGELPNALAIEEGVGPGDLLFLPSSKR
jgi:hypothetical protein